MVVYWLFRFLVGEYWLVVSKYIGCLQLCDLCCLLPILINVTNYYEFMSISYNGNWEENLSLNSWLFYFWYSFTFTFASLFIYFFPCNFFQLILSLNGCKRGKKSDSWLKGMALQKQLYLASLRHSWIW